jgi:hypothetical protein
MKSSKLTRLGQQVKQFAAQFLQSGTQLLGAIVPLAELAQWVREEAPKHRDSEYAPLRTLMLFIEQVLAADHSCQDAVARGASHKRGRKSAKINLNTGPYCKARMRLPLGLVLLFTGISFFAYIIRSMLGAGLGYVIAGLLGGLISSTNVTLSFSRMRLKNAFSGRTV